MFCKHELDVVGALRELIPELYGKVVDEFHPAGNLFIEKLLIFVQLDGVLCKDLLGGVDGNYEWGEGFFVAWLVLERASEATTVIKLKSSPLHRTEPSIADYLV